LPIQNPKSKIQNSIGWLSVYFAGGYLICSAISNKDPRYIMPYLPILAVFLAYCLVQWRGRWRGMRWLAVGLGLLVLLGKLFPVPVLEDFASAMSPGWLSHPYLGQAYPNGQVIETILQAAPYQKATLGVIPSIEPINHNTLNYYGALREFQVAGRELGSKPEAVAQDGRSLDWFLVQPGCHGSKVECNGLAQDSQIAFGESLADNPEFRAEQAWELPSDSRLQLYRRRLPSVAVKPLTDAQQKVQLNRVTVPKRVPPGLPVPVTYEWSGSWEQLASGLVLLTWKSAKNPATFWLHDFGIARGELQAQMPQTGEFQVIERTAMLPAADLPAGDYNLTATYLNRKTGETYAIPAPTVAVTIDPSAAAVPAPELDRVTKLRQLALNLPKGIAGLAPIFQQVDRLNQYDAERDYLRQAEKTLAYRLAQNPGAREINWRYGLLLSQVLQENPQGAIATLRQLVKLDPTNPYTHAYLAFVYLYNWQPKAAEIALKPALRINPNIREIQALSGISYLMQGNLIKGWQAISPILFK
jgi:tetratricopeptide (TPR) repeat protein